MNRQKIILFAGSLLVLAVFAVGFAEQSKSSAEQEVLAGVRQWEAGLPWKQQDTSAIEKVLAADFTEINISGGFMDRSHFIEYYKTIVADMKAGKFTRYSDVSEIKVRIYGETGVVTGLMKTWGKDGPELRDYARSARFSSVWVKRNGRWQEVYYQPTPVVTQ